MILYLYGPDIYRRDKVLKNKILEPYFQKYSNNIRTFDSKGEGLEEFILNQSLFDKVKIGIIHSPIKEIAKIIKEFKDDPLTTLIITADKKLTKEFAYLLKEPVKSYSFDLLKGRELTSYIIQEATERGVTLTKEELMALNVLFAGDLWAVSTELDKKAVGGVIETTESVGDFFALVKRFSRASSSERLEILYLLMKDNDSAMVFNMITAFSFKKGKMADYDILIKSGKLEYEEALLDIAIS